MPAPPWRPPPAPGGPCKARPAFAKVALELQGRVEHLGADRVAELLGVWLADLVPLLEGRAAPPAEGLRRLRAEAE